MFLVCTRCNYAKPGRPSFEGTDVCPKCKSRGEEGRLVAALAPTSPRVNLAAALSRASRAVPSFIPRP